MEIQPKKVRIVSLKPHKVVVEILETGKEVQFPRRVFDRRVDMGLFEVVNPDLIPTVF